MRVCQVIEASSGGSVRVALDLTKELIAAGDQVTFIYSPTRADQAAQEDIALLRQQIGICKKIITGLTRRAEAERLEDTTRQAADGWLESIRQHWHASRPKAGSRLIIGSDEKDAA